MVLSCQLFLSFFEGMVVLGKFKIFGVVFLITISSIYFVNLVAVTDQNLENISLSELKAQSLSSLKNRLLALEKVFLCVKMS